MPRIKKRTIHRCFIRPVRVNTVLRTPLFDQRERQNNDWDERRGHVDDRGVFDVSRVDSQQVNGPRPDKQREAEDRAPLNRDAHVCSSSAQDGPSRQGRRRARHVLHHVMVQPRPLYDCWFRRQHPPGPGSDIESAVDELAHELSPAAGQGEHPFVAGIGAEVHFLADRSDEARPFGLNLADVLPAQLTRVRADRLDLILAEILLECRHDPDRVDSVVGRPG